MFDVPAYLAFGGDLDDVAGAEGGVGVGDEVALVGLELLREGGGGLLANWSGGIRWAELEAHFFEEPVVGLFGGADFDRLHHFAGGDDDTAEDSGWDSRHGGVWDGWY